MRAFESLDALLDEVDAVTIVVPTPAHFAVAARVLERGHPRADREADRGDARGSGRACSRLAKRTARSCRPATSSGSTARCARALPYVDRAALHRERPARAVQSARLRRRRGARPDDPRHRPRAHARRWRRRRRWRRSACRCSRRSWTSRTRGSRSSRAPWRTSRRAACRASGCARSGSSSRADTSRSTSAAGTGEFYRLRRRRGRRGARARRAGRAALEQFVERIPLEAPEGEPLRLELESFVAAVRGEAPVP